MSSDSSGMPAGMPPRAAGTAATPKAADSGFDPHVPDIDYGILDSLIGHAIRRAQIRIYEDFVASLAQWQITPPRFSALVIISRNPKLKLTDLAHILGIARSGAVLLVDALQEMNLVERRPAPGDRRAYSLVLTPTGKRTLEPPSRLSSRMMRMSPRHSASRNRPRSSRCWHASHHRVRRDSKPVPRH